MPSSHNNTVRTTMNCTGYQKIYILNDIVTQRFELQLNSQRLQPVPLFIQLLIHPSIHSSTAFLFILSSPTKVSLLPDFAAASITVVSSQPQPKCVHVSIQPSNHVSSLSSRRSSLYSIHHGFPQNSVCHSLYQSFHPSSHPSIHPSSCLCSSRTGFLGPRDKRIYLVLRGLIGSNAMILLFYAVQQMPLADATVIMFRWELEGTCGLLQHCKYIFYFLFISSAFSLFPCVSPQPVPSVRTYELHPDMLSSLTHVLSLSIDPSVIQSLPRCWLGSSWRRNVQSGTVSSLSLPSLVSSSSPDHHSSLASKCVALKATTLTTSRGLSLPLQVIQNNSV